MVRIDTDGKRTNHSAGGIGIAGYTQQCITIAAFSFLLNQKKIKEKILNHR